MTWHQAARLISSSVNAASGKATDALFFASLKRGNPPLLSNPLKKRNSCRKSHLRSSEPWRVLTP